MPRPWCDFFVGGKNANGKVKTFFLLSLLLSYPSLVQAESTPATPSVPSMDSVDVLPLSAEALTRLRELPWVLPKQQAIKVGDSLLLKIDSQDARPFSFKRLEGSKSLLDQGWLQEASSPGEQTDLVLVPLQSGKRSLPQFIVVGPQGEPIGKTASLIVEVQSSLSKTPPPDLLGPVGLGFPWWIAVLAALLAMTFVITWVIWIRRRLQRRKKKSPEAVVAIEVSIEQSAYAKLDALVQRKHLERFEFKSHYFALSEILKEYFGKRFDFDGQESTSAELVATLEQRGIPTDLLREIRICFERLDQVKFTDFVPALDEAMGWVPQCRDFISKTSKVGPHAI